MRSAALLLSTLVLVGCTSSEGEGTSGGGAGGTDVPGDCAPGQATLDDGSCLEPGMQPNGCPAGEWLSEDLGCLPAGTQANGCPAGELALEDGTCTQPGVPASACGEGFVHDGDAACEPVLPPMPCDPGEMARIGKSSCSPISTCGSGTWGDIPVEADTVYVDATANGPQDGSTANPFATIQAAVDAAPTGAIVAIAAGTYDEDVVIDAPVRLWGTCPSAVAIQGTTAALALGANADGTEIRDLAITGDGIGIQIDGAEAVLLERLWIHDTGGYGVDSSDAPPETTAVTIRDCLVEATTEQGIWLEGTDGIVEDVELRNVQPAGEKGWGMSVLADETTAKRGTLELRRVWAHHNTGVGVILHSIDATVEDLVVQNTLPTPNDRFGRGLVVQSDTISGPSDASLERVFVEQARDGALVISQSDVNVSDSVFRDVGPNLDAGLRGYGIGIQSDPVSGTRSHVTVRRCTVDRASEHAVFVAGSDAVLEGLLLRDGQALPDGSFGRALQAGYEGSSSQRSEVHVVGSRFAGMHDLGALAEGSQLTLEGVRVEDVEPDLAAINSGFAVVGQDSQIDGTIAEIEIRGSLLERSHSAGLLVAGGSASVEGTLIRDVALHPDLGVARGLSAQDDHLTGVETALRVVGSTVQNTEELGVMAAGAVLEMEGVVVADIAPTPMGIGGRGINVQPNPYSGRLATLDLRYSRVERTVSLAVATVGTSMNVTSTVVSDVAARPSDGGFGDGLAAVSILGTPTSMTVQDSRVEGAERAAVAVFGGSLALGHSLLSCNTIDLAAEDNAGYSGEFQDAGGNVCGCGEEQACKALSSKLTPPEPTVVTDTVPEN
jgi:hypothetical protein